MLQKLDITERLSAPAHTSIIHPLGLSTDYFVPFNLHSRPMRKVPSSFPFYRRGSGDPGKLRDLLTSQSQDEVDPGFEPVVSYPLGYPARFTPCTLLCGLLSPYSTNKHWSCLTYARTRAQPSQMSSFTPPRIPWSIGCAQPH